MNLREEVLHCHWRIVEILSHGRWRKMQVWVVKSLPLALNFLQLFTQFPMYKVRNCESVCVYVFTPLKMLSLRKYNFQEQNQWWKGCYSQWTFLDFCFQLKQNQIIIFALLVFVELKSRQGFTCSTQPALSMMLGTGKGLRELMPQNSQMMTQSCARTCHLSPSSLLIVHPI